MNFDIFCKVIDNFGDAGVSLRLARSLVNKGHKVRLLCDRIETLKSILDEDDNHNIDILCWHENMSYTPRNITILAFSCRPNDTIVKRISRNGTLTINLEYLSAEKWVEDFHTVRSFADGLNCYYFFPGFTSKTGGLVIEDDFLNKIKNKRIEKDASIRKISLFSYKNENLKIILDILGKSKKHNVVNVFEGLALDNINTILNMNMKAGDSIQIDNFTYNIKAMVPQSHYDDILIQSDLNIVRGEDSIVRAMLTGNIFLWQIYPQNENTHIKKLNAFIDRMEETVNNEELINIFRNLNNMYNSNGRFDFREFDYDKFESDFIRITQKWSNHLIAMGSLTDKLTEFCSQKI